MKSLQKSERQAGDSTARHPPRAPCRHGLRETDSHAQTFSRGCDGVTGGERKQGQAGMSKSVKTGMRKNPTRNQSTVANHRTQDNVRCEFIFLVKDVNYKVMKTLPTLDGAVRGAMTRTPTWRCGGSRRSGWAGPG